MHLKTGHACTHMSTGRVYGFTVTRPFHDNWAFAMHHSIVYNASSRTAILWPISQMSLKRFHFLYSLELIRSVCDVINIIPFNYGLRELPSCATFFDAAICSVLPQCTSELGQLHRQSTDSARI